MIQWIYNKIAQLKKKEISLVRDTKWFNYFYATLWQIQDKISPILEELKLLVIHRVENQKVITKIIDLEDNSFIESWIDIWEVKTETKKDLIDKNQNKIWESIEINTLDPQGVGSIITYYRRYNLLALLDLETEDDDGASWSQRAQTKPQYIQKETKTDIKSENICNKCWAEMIIWPKWTPYCKPCYVKFKESQKWQIHTKNIEEDFDLSNPPF